MAATEEGLRLLLTADVQQFERALKDAETATRTAAAGIVKAGTQIQNSSGWIQGYQNGIKSLADGLKTGESRFVAFGSTVDKTGKITQNYTKANGQAITALTGLTRVAQDAPFGFIAIGNNLSELIGQFGALSKSSGGAGGAFKALGGALLGPGGVVLGLNLLITGITVAVQKYGSLGAAVNALLFPLNEQQRLQKSINDTLVQGQKDAQKEVVSLDTLYRATQNVNIPIEQRRKLVDELQKQYPEYFKNLKDEAILAGQAATQYNNLRDAIVAQATVEAFKNKITEQGAKNAELLDRRNTLENTLKEIISPEFIRRLERYNKELSGEGRAALGTSFGSDFVKNADKFNSISRELETIGKEQNSVNTATEAYNKQIDKLVEQFKGKPLLKIGDDGKGGAAKEVETVSSILAQLEKDLIKVNTQFSVTGGTAKELATDITRAYENAAGALANIGVSGDNPIITKLRSDLEAALRDPAAVTRDLPPINLPVSIDTSAIKPAVTTTIQELGPVINGFTRQINELIETNLREGLASVAGAIGEALASGEIKGVFQSLLNTVASGLEQFGKLLLLQGLAIQAFQTSIKTLQPAVALVAGAAVIAAAGAIRGYANSFAVGGTAYGPQMAVIGDNAAQKEHVLSDQQLRKIADGAGVGAGGNNELVARISGTELIVMLKRAGLQISRG